MKTITHTLLALCVLPFGLFAQVDSLEMDSVLIVVDTTLLEENLLTTNDLNEDTTLVQDSIIIPQLPLGILTTSEMIKAAFFSNPPSHQNRLTRITPDIDEWEDIHTNILSVPYDRFVFADDAKNYAHLFADGIGTLDEEDQPVILDLRWIKICSESERVELNHCLRNWLRVVQKETGKRPIIRTGEIFAKEYLEVTLFLNYQWWVTSLDLEDDPEIARLWKNMDLNVFILQ
ncbi:MAG: GH25 family lysozyme [Crocinitomicaceae bacterium]|nr:GH25 family lysozyme [Crocinitomicaceae bacterium]